MQNLRDFTNRATDYNASRPEYNEILIQIVNYLNGNYFGSVADIGAGTGLLSEALINSNFTDTVYSIEPCKDMFTFLINKRCQSEYWKFINSTSENTTLRDQSIDVIFCAQSFHFFNTEQTKTEFQRILKTAGKIILIWGVLDNDDNVVYELNQILLKYRVDARQVRTSPNFILEQNLEDFFHPKKYSELKSTIHLKYSLDKLTSYVFSFSYMPFRHDCNAKSVEMDLENFFYTHQVNDEVPLKLNYFTYISS